MRSRFAQLTRVCEPSNLQLTRARGNGYRCLRQGDLVISAQRCLDLGQRCRFFFVEELLSPFL
jgi:hypothetical protein